jgi:hypothetical protein
MTEIQNPKKLASDLIWVLDIEIWNLFVIWCLYFVISGISGLGICRLSLCSQTAPKGPLFPSVVLEKA